MAYTRAPSSLSGCCSGCAAGASTCGEDGAAKPSPTLLGVPVLYVAVAGAAAFLLMRKK